MHRSSRHVLGLSLLLQFGACAADPTSPSVAELDAHAANSTAGKMLALGKAHGCSLDAPIDGVLCWGDNRKGQATVPALTAPKYIAAGGDTTCAIDGNTVQCWGDGSHGQTTVPYDTFGSTALTVGDGHVCAIGPRGAIKCWGDDSSGQLRAPANLGSIAAIGAGSHHTCALADGGVTCWGDSSKGQLTVPPMAAPTQLSVAASHACAIDGGKVVCWGEDVPAILANIPAVNDAQLVAAGASHACVLSGAGVQCWGDAVSGDLTPRELTLPTQLAVGGGDGFSHACSRHLQGVACWGDDNFHQIDYNGAPLHIVHRSEARISASSEVVWNIIMDLDRYPDWNPYTIGMMSTLKIGDPMVMQVKMSDTLTIEQTENIRVLEQGHKVCWGIDTTTPEFNSGERCQWLEPLPDGGTHWINEDLIEGTANPLVTALFGDSVQNGFDAVGVALKKRAESM